MVRAPRVGQIEAFAAAAGVTLEPGWKVELAKRVKASLLRQERGAEPHRHEHPEPIAVARRA